MQANRLTEEDLFRVLASLIESELRNLRRSSSGPAALLDELGPRQGWTEETLIRGAAHGVPSLEVDSIEWLALASTVNRMFHLFEHGIEEYLLRRRKLGEWANIVWQAMERRPDEITFHTSGSTGTPKTVTHRVEDLFAEAEAFAGILKGRNLSRIVSFVPPHHIYGYIHSVLLPKALDLPLVESAPIAPGDLVVSHPLRWGFVDSSTSALKPGIVGLTSSAPMPEGRTESLLGKGLSAMIEIYGSTETAGVGWRDHPDCAYRLLPRWTRGTLTAMDELVWVDDVHFRVGPRKDEAVQVGGVNVFPRRIEDRIRAHPLVADCRVRPMRPSEGERLKAFVVPRDPALTLLDLDAWLRRELPAAERPAQVTFGAAIPTTAEGKACDW